MVEFFFSCLCVWAYTLIIVIYVLLIFSVMRTMLPCLSVYMLLVLCLSDVQNILVPLQLNYVPCNEFLVPMYTTSVSASSVILIVVSCKSKMTIFLLFFLSLRLVDFLACLNVAPRRHCYFTVFIMRLMKTVTDLQCLL